MVSEKGTDKGFDGGAMGVARPRELPSFMYVYHVIGEHNHRLYFLQIEGPEDDVKGELERVITGITEGSLSKVPKSSDGSYHWRAYSYLVFITQDVDISGVTFTPSAMHTIRDIKTMSLHDGWSAAYCINERKKRGGGKLGKGDSEPFTWDLQHARRSGLSMKGIVTHEGTGTNTGP